MTEEVEIVVPGDANQVYTCITAEARPFASHCWIRAGAHIYRMQQFDYRVRVQAATTCERMAEAVAKQMKRPQRIEPVKGFSWGSFKTIKPIR